MQNLAALYSVHAMNYVLPLITFPYLTRTLGPNGWGGVAFVQSLGTILIMVIEYGFTLSAGREVSVRRNDREWLANKLGSVTAAKALLLIAVIAFAGIGVTYIPYFRSNRLMLIAGFVWAGAQGMNPLWFYQGLERMRFTSSIDIIFKSIGVAAIFLLVRSQSQAPLVLVIYAAASVGSTSYIYFHALREFGIRPAGARCIATELKAGFSLFLFQASVSLFTSANGFVLGLFVPVRIVGIYVGAERISRSVIGLLNPINQALYPRINLVLHENWEAAVMIIRKAFVSFVIGAVLVTSFLLAAAPIIVKFLLGGRFVESVPTLRILALLIPLIAASNVLGIHWMLPLRRDRAFSIIVGCAGVINIIFACILAPRFAENGMASAVLIAEFTVTCGCFLYLGYQKLNPLSPKFAHQQISQKVYSATQ
jgi:PST family polysaccharide transporter